jgi:hypothetical protein
MVRMISNSSDRATVKVLHPVMAKDSHLDTTKEVVIEINQYERKPPKIGLTTLRSYRALVMNRFLPSHLNSCRTCGDCHPDICDSYNLHEYCPISGPMWNLRKLKYRAQD